MGSPLLRHIILRCIRWLIISYFMVTCNGGREGRGVGWFSMTHLKKLSMQASFLQASFPDNFQQIMLFIMQGFYKEKKKYIHNYQHLKVLWSHSCVNNQRYVIVLFSSSIAGLWGKKECIMSLEREVCLKYNFEISLEAKCTKFIQTKKKIKFDNDVLFSNDTGILGKFRVLPTSEYACVITE